MPSLKITGRGAEKVLVLPGLFGANGIFDAADPDSLAELLSREPDLVIERRTDEIVIRQR